MTMRRLALVCGLILTSPLLSVSAAPSVEQLGPLIYGRLPNRAFAYASDTSLSIDFGVQDSEISATRFSLSDTASAGQIVWFGYYESQNLGFDPDPPSSESFRIRFYRSEGSFPPTALPGEILFDEAHADVTRVLTGLLAGGRREYRYVVSMNEPFTASAGIPYWMSIAQIDDVASFFRWETSSTNGVRAFQHPENAPLNLRSGDLAFELRVPEPASGFLLIGAVFVAFPQRPAGFGGAR